MQLCVAEELRLFLQLDGERVFQTSLLFIDQEEAFETGPDSSRSLELLLEPKSPLSKLSRESLEVARGGPRYHRIDSLRSTSNGW